MKSIQKAATYYKQKALRRKEIPNGTFEASSIGDLAFLLLIFFIVTSSFILRQGIFLSLPSNSAGSRKVENEKIINIYPKNKDFVFESRSINRENLIDELREKKKKISDMVVVIYMKKGIFFDRLVDALSVVKESGIKQVSLKDIE